MTSVEKLDSRGFDRAARSGNLSAAHELVTNWGLPNGTLAGVQFLSVLVTPAGILSLQSRKP